jgi:hypothetical protein
MTVHRPNNPARIAVFAAAIVFVRMAALASPTVFDSILHAMAPQQQEVLANADHFHLQILYTQVNRDRFNRPHFAKFRFKVDPRQYFYPASLVKLPVAPLALEKIRLLRRPGLTGATAMRVDSSIDCAIGYDSAMDGADLPPGCATVESSIERMLLVSDNKGFNRLWDFLTRDYVNKRMAQCGYPKTRLLHRLWPCTVEQNRLNNPVVFLSPAGKILYKQSLSSSKLPDANPLSPIDIGNGRIGYGMLIPESMHADNLNYLPLDEAHDFLVGLMFPESVDPSKRLALTTQDYRFLRTWLCLLPRESGISCYGSLREFPDNFKKILLFGDGKQPCLPTLREFNVVGRAYGFVTDVAYFADFDARIEFFLSATIYVNDDGIINDNRYEYESVALPFFSALGNAVYKYEKKRPRKYKPDLREFEPEVPKKVTK